MSQSRDEFSHFAAAALNGLLANPNSYDLGGKFDIGLRRKNIIKEARDIAKAMLEEMKDI